MNKQTHNSGFTLIELIVVLSIFAVMLMFSFPLFKDIHILSDTSMQAPKIATLIQSLKREAILKNLDFFLHIDTVSNVLWISDESMDDEKKETAKKDGFPLLDGMSIIDVEFAGLIEPIDQEYVLRVSKKGFSDFVFIHCISGQEDVTIKIEPFLFDVQIIKGHVGFGTCD